MLTEGANLTQAVLTRFSRLVSIQDNIYSNRNIPLMRTTKLQVDHKKSLQGSNATTVRAPKLVLEGEQKAFKNHLLGKQ